MEEVVTKISAIWKGKMYRRNNLPNSIRTVKKILQEQCINFCESNDDGRTNSLEDETSVIKILEDKLPNRIYKQPPRFWSDMLVHDFQYGLLPVNIKSSGHKQADNAANITALVHALTDEQLDVKKKHDSRLMTKLFIKKSQNPKEYNYNDKKDYYFLVLNKSDSKDITINSIKGITNLTSNASNLPFQINWSKNKTFEYKPVSQNIKMVINAIGEARDTPNEKLRIYAKECVEQKKEPIKQNYEDDKENRSNDEEIMEIMSLQNQLQSLELEMSAIQKKIETIKLLNKRA